MPEGKSDDLMEAAIRAVDAAREDLLLAKASDNKALLRKVAIEVVHGALLAEQQRCAKIADDMYGEGRSRPYDDVSSEAGWNDATQAISKAILHRGGASA